jgi:hypothetical protein
MHTANSRFIGNITPDGAALSAVAIVSVINIDVLTVARFG